MVFYKDSNADSGSFKAYAKIAYCYATSSYTGFKPSHAARIASTLAYAYP